MKNKDIQTYVQFFLNDVELNLSVTNKLGRQKEVLKNYGYISIEAEICKDGEHFWYDGIPYFMKVCNDKRKRKEFKKEFREELKQKGLSWKETYKTIKTLLQRAEKLNLLS